MARQLGPQVALPLTGCRTLTCHITSLSLGFSLGMIKKVMGPQAHAVPGP